MKWIKLGRIFTAEKQFPWMISHTTVTVPEHIEGDLFRIYFSTRDDRNRSHIGYMVIDLNRPQDILEIADTPVLAPGALGTFDDSGAMFSWLLHHNGRRILYYIGWTLGATVPWRLAIGLATCSISGPPIFERHSQGPILDRSILDPFFVTAPCVLIESGLWRMWYLSGTGWADSRKGLRPRYNVRYAESADGIIWRPTGRVCVDHMHAGEVGIGRPCVIKDSDRYRMWFSYRGDDFGYEMGYAESPDGLTWERFDNQIGLEHSDSGWDSEMTAYPTVFDHRGNRYMLYCGNGYGKAGFGLAVLLR